METWKDIPGYEGRYQASDEGRVRSVDRLVKCVDKVGAVRVRRSLGRVLRPGLCRGYQIVGVSPLEGVPHKTVAVHLLVAKTFVEGYEIGNEVNHKDGVKANCAASNLEWVSKKENQQHAVRLGLRKSATPVISPSGELYPSINTAARAEKVSPSVVRSWLT